MTFTARRLHEKDNTVASARGEAEPFRRDTPQAARRRHCNVGLLLSALLVVAVLPNGAARSADTARRVPPAPPQPEPKVSQRYVTSLVRDLAADQYARRARACQQLVRLGSAAVPLLQEAAERGDAETTTRAVTVLEAIFLGPDPDAADAAEAALEQLQSSTNVLAANQADAVLAANQRVRELRALERIVALGGVVKDVLGQPIDIRDPTALGREIPILQLGLDWTGGDEGLKYVKKLQSLQVLYVITGCGVSQKALDELAQSMPNLKSIERRGPAYLGVGGTDHEEGCIITSVRAGSAAARAGIRQGDVLLKFDGQPVRTFRQLIELIGRKRPGQKVPVVVRRADQELTLEVVLDEWK